MKSVRITDITARNIVLILSGFVLAIFVIFTVYIFVRGLPAFGIIFNIMWNPAGNQYGIVAFLLGTITVTVIAVLICAPLSIFSCVFLVEFCPNRFRRIAIMFLELMAAVPSVIYGFLGLITIGQVLHPSYLLAALVLSFMILPITSSFIIQGLQAVSESYKNAAYALGAKKTELVTLMLKKSSNSILTGITLGTARAIGEGIAVSLLIGGSVAMPQFHNFWQDYLARSGSTMTTIIITDFLEASGQHQDALFGVGCVLFIMVSIMVGTANFLFRRMRRKNYDR